MKLFKDLFLTNKNNNDLETLLMIWLMNTVNWKVSERSN